MRKEVVFILPFPWYSLYQRPHHFAYHFKKNGYAIKIIEFRHIVRINSIINKMRFNEHNMVADNVYSVVKIPFFPYIQSYQLLRYARTIVNQSGNVEQRLIWLQGIEPTVDYNALFKMLDGKIIFDISDSFPDFITDTFKRMEFEAKEKRIAQIADIVITTADILYDKFKKVNDKTVIIRNGVDFQAYKCMRDIPNNYISTNFNIFKMSNIVCYQGAVAEWFDFDLMDEVIRSNPDIFFLFVGMIDIRVKKEFNKLLRYQNSRHIGTVSPTVLPQILSRIDVGIIPFKINNLIKSTNPIKFYEYMAAGRPVVATPMPEVIRYKNEGIVAIADEPISFSNAIREMLVYSNNAEKVERRIKIAEQNSWESRFNEVIKNVLKA